MHLTFEQAIGEPNEIIELAFLIWKMDAQRDNLKSRKTSE